MRLEGGHLLKLGAEAAALVAACPPAYYDRAGSHPLACAGPSNHPSEVGELTTVDTVDVSNGYESNALEYVGLRERSPIGSVVVADWAASLDPAAEVLEIGCGAGVPVSRALVDAGLKLWAIDASPSLLRIFRPRFPDVPARCEAAETSDFFGRTYDAAISIGLLFLLEESAQLGLIRKVSETLRAGGRFLFSAPLEAGTWRDAVTGFESRSLGRERYEEALSSAGLRVLRTWQDEGGSNYYEAQRADSGPVEDASQRKGG